MRGDLKFPVFEIMRHVDMLKVEAESFPQTSEICHSTWHHIPEDWNLHQRYCENLKSHRLSPPCVHYVVPQETQLLFHFEIARVL